MKHETSPFESSETLATLLASTPLLEESWRLCSHANAAAQGSFSVSRVGEVAYVAFSAVQTVGIWPEDRRGNLVEIQSVCEGVFDSFPRGGEEAVMVHGGLLQLFVLFYNSQIFQQKILEIVNECKSVVFTGHSLGGPIASLSALWLLSNIQTNSSSITVFCITYGSPMLGNEPFSQVILQERWAGNFCHVVARHDLLPRLLFAPSYMFDSQFHALFQLWHLSMTAPYFGQIGLQILVEKKDELFNKVLACVACRSRGGGDQETSLFWPFGSYLFCTDKGTICLDNEGAIVKFLYFIMMKGSATSCIEDHLEYGKYVEKACWQYLLKRSSVDACFDESSNDAGITLALQSLELTTQEPAYGDAKDCLLKARQLGCNRNLNNAKMAVNLAKITPLRAQIEWYKAFCDDSDEKLGYYDSFKLRTASKKGTKVSLNRLRLGWFWDELINMLQTNKLTHDFHKLPKYVNAAQFYKLLVEPLEIAEYYRNGEHKKKGHYIEHGRERRFKIFDKWWRDRKVGDEENNPRSKFASLTQDSCFWARVEEARDCLYQFRGETEKGNRTLLLEKIEKFEQYASSMVNRKEVSIDVLAENSSYNLFREEWKELKSQSQLLQPHFPGFQDGMVQ
ncbi:lipase-like PAD4 [Primulina huaijiensis]|uniref:lipase-like PAD4 n=1 Tax=Primulina huaijiensis TaxID=1492673 RepID=UPI003CC716D0